jgi:tRNA-dihydrouridine synthase B
VIDLRESWRIGPVEVPTRLVLAPMAGVSVQAFRRQGRRYGAGLVCSEMVSCAGIEHRNEKTLGYLRVAADEHPLAIQLFGSEPQPMADAARMVEAVGADIVDVNFGCPVKKVTKTGAGAHLLEDQDRACAIISAIADAVDLPVSVKLRRGVRDGSRAALELGPRLVDAGAASLTLHPRLARPRSGRRVRGRDLARAGANGARDDGRRGGHGRPRRAGKSVGLEGDRRR